LQEQIDDILQLKHGSTIFIDKQKKQSEQEQAVGRLEKFLKNNPLNEMVNAVTVAFNDLRKKCKEICWMESEIEHLIQAITLSCDNRKVYEFYGLKYKFDLPIEIAMFKIYKKSVLISVASNLKLL
jgi:replicative superfamily II helicase